MVKIIPNNPPPVAHGKDFKLKFGGGSHEIDVHTLIGVLISSTDILQEINKEIAPDKKLEVKIQALAPGSFLVHIELNLTLLQGLADFFTMENAAHAGVLLGAFVDLIDLHKFLKGEVGKTEQANGNTLTITNNNGQLKQVNNTIYNIYLNNEKVGPALSKNFAALDSNPEVTEFDVLDANENTLLEIKRAEFEELSKYNSTKEKNINVFVQTTKLKLFFDPNHRWYFNWKDGKKISAPIADPVFNQKVKDGIGRYASGDTLEVELEVTQLYDPNYETFVNHSYRILKVIDHKPGPEQQQIFP